MDASVPPKRTIPRANRHRVAACLWALRKGVGVETTCKKHGWHIRSIWNNVRLSPAYRQLKARHAAKYPQGRINHRAYAWVSRKYPLEKQFADRIESLLQEAGEVYVREPLVKAAISRCDFRMGSTLIECKTDVSTMSMNKALGQCWIYKVIAEEDCMLVIPDDVVPRIEWMEAFGKMSVRVLNESGFISVLRGESPIEEVRCRRQMRIRRGKYGVIKQSNLFRG
jgi:hypothetical protein